MNSKTLRQAQFDPMWTLYQSGEDLRAKTPYGIQSLRSRSVPEAQKEVAEMRQCRYDRALREWKPYDR